MSGDAWGAHVSLLRSAMEVLRRLLETYGGHALPGSGLDDHVYDGPQLRPEVRLALRRMLVLRTALGCDRLAGLGDLVAAPRHSQALFAVVRSVYDAVSPPWWVIEPFVGPPPASTADRVAAIETVQARMLLFFAAEARQAEDVWRDTHAGEHDQVAQSRLEQCRLLATLIGFTTVKDPSQRAWSVNGSKWLGFGHIAKLLAAHTDKPGTSLNPYSYLSAETHGRRTMMAFGDPFGPLSTDKPESIQMTPDPRDVAIWTSKAARAAYLSLVALCMTHGWDAEPVHAWYSGWEALIPT